MRGLAPTGTDRCCLQGPRCPRSARPGHRGGVTHRGPPVRSPPPLAAEPPIPGATRVSPASTTTPPASQPPARRSLTRRPCRWQPKNVGLPCWLAPSRIPAALARVATARCGRGRHPTPTTPASTGCTPRSPWRGDSCAGLCRTLARRRRMMRRQSVPSRRVGQPAASSSGAVGGATRAIAVPSTCSW